MYIKVVWDQGVPCEFELHEHFDPFLIQVWGGKDFQSLGILKEPTSYADNESKSTIDWVAQEYVRFTLLEQCGDLSESRIRNFIDSGNWMLKKMAGKKIKSDATDDYKPLTKIFQEIAAKTRSEARNRSSKPGNRSTLIHLHNVNSFLKYLYPNDASAISDHLHHAKIFESIIEPPSEFCVIETVRFVANLVATEEKKLIETLSGIKDKTTTTINDVLSFFKLTKDYRNLFLYLFISITGINGTNAMLISLEDFDISNNKKTSGKSVSVYKARANRVVSFEIPKEVLIKYINPFVSIFKTYNLLCDKLNIDSKFDYIGRQVFRQDNKYRHISQYFIFSSWLKNKKSDFICQINQRLEQENIIDHEIKIPTPRDLRNYKATAIESKKGHMLSSIIMQHSPETGVKHYLRRQEKEAIDNLGEFYADFENIISNIGKKVKDRLTVIPAGKCSANDEQKSVIQLNTEKSAYIVGDCTTPTGCLFCSFFVVHSDEEGIYKLISMREYILLKHGIVSYHYEIENNYGAILDRINNILQHLKVELKDVAIEWIEKAEIKVAYGLHPIWQELFDMDMALLDVSA